MANQSWRYLQQSMAWDASVRLMNNAKTDVAESTNCNSDLNSINDVEEEDDSVDSSSCYLCPHCGKACSSERELNLHISNEHAEDIAADDVNVVDHMSDSDNPTSVVINGNGNGYTYACKLCPKTFSSSSTLNVHYTHTHKDKPQYDCEICGQSFNVKREYATHKRLHDGHPAHRCRQCGKEFGTRQLLRKHELWHTGERNHVCSQCGKAFFQKGHLTQHLMIHAGGRPHACHLCPKTFIFKFDLNRHMKIHAERENGADSSTGGNNGVAESPQQQCHDDVGADSSALLTNNHDVLINNVVMSRIFKRRRSGGDGGLSDYSLPPVTVEDHSSNNNNNNDEIVTPKLNDNDDPRDVGVSHEDTVSDSKGEVSPSNSSVYSTSSVIMINGIGGFSTSCDKCADYRNQLEMSRRCVAELETLLVQRHQEIEALKWKVQRVSSVAGHLLETCSDFDKLWILHSKKVYSQMQNVLSMLQ